MRDKRRSMHRPMFSLLAGILAAALLAGCGSSPAGQENSTSAAADTAESAVAGTEEKAPADSETPAAVSDTMSENTAEQSETAAGGDAAEQSETAACPALTGSLQRQSRTRKSQKDWLSAEAMHRMIRRMSGRR